MHEIETFHAIHIVFCADSAQSQPLFFINSRRLEAVPDETNCQPDCGSQIKSVV